MYSVNGVQPQKDSATVSSAAEQTTACGPIQRTDRTRGDGSPRGPCQGRRAGASWNGCSCMGDLTWLLRPESSFPRTRPRQSANSQQQDLSASSGESDDSDSY